MSARISNLLELIECKSLHVVFDLSEMYFSVGRSVDGLGVDHAVHASLSSVFSKQFACFGFDNLSLFSD